MSSFHSRSFSSPHYPTTSTSTTKHPLRSHSISTITFTSSDQISIMTNDKIARFERLYPLDGFPEDHIKETNDAEAVLKRSTQGPRKQSAAIASYAASSSLRR